MRVSEGRERGGGDREREEGSNPPPHLTLPQCQALNPHAGLAGQHFGRAGVVLESGAPLAGGAGDRADAGGS
eukprot:1191028-Rhodomonas_salina.2